MPERVKARHILIKTQGKSDAEKKAALAKAQDLLKQLKAGADFSELAKKIPTIPSNAPKGGDLGWFVRGQMVPEFDKAAFALKPGELSGIVTTAVRVSHHQGQREGNRAGEAIRGSEGGTGGRR